MAIGKATHSAVHEFTVGSWQDEIDQSQAFSTLLIGIRLEKKINLELRRAQETVELCFVLKWSRNKATRMATESIVTLRTLLKAIIFSTWAVSAQAAPVTWELDLQFEDNGTAAGSFVWDSDLNAATAWSISVSGGLFSGGQVLPGDTFSNDSAGHVASVFTQNGFSFIEFRTEDVTYFNGPDRERVLRLGLGFSGLDVLDTAVALLPLVADTVNQFSLTSTGFLDCGNCSPVRNGNEGSFISSPSRTPVPVPLPASLPLLLAGIGALGLVRKFSK
ncbi:VPLPA-CTERM sorting domain-containing protein [Roseibium sp. HPY-6]|uniref:VPLPA-CTERM sorting domain-containing protein n=1 Tax=Roseibium sp. HPY-6 TaxID=3229852 RepID=UPI00338FF32C